MNSGRSTMRVAYWICQLAGWGLWCAIGVWMTRMQQGFVDRNTIVGYALFAVYSIVLTHVFGRLIKRRRWLGAGAWSTGVRLLAGVFVVATIQTVLVLLVSFALGDRSNPLARVGLILGLWLNMMFATGIWTTLFTWIAAWMRARQARELAATLERNLETARLKSLEAQISPHFLFNCLNSIRGMIGEDASRAQDMVTRLANILRHNLLQDMRSAEPLGAQLEIVEDYLALEALRLEERLHTSIAIEEAAKSALVPSMLLQTLVENAIKHGIAPRPDGGRIDVRAQLADDVLTICVENTGRLESAPGASTRIGLSNLRERLRILCGAAASLEISEAAGDIVRVVVSIPQARRAEDATTSGSATAEISTHSISNR